MKVLLSSFLGLLFLELALQVGSMIAWLTAGVPTPAADGQRTVLCIGDSYTYGLGASHSDRSYPGTLQTLLRERLAGDAPRVVNAGWPGQNSRETLLKLEAQLAEHRPSLVCVLVGLNDTWTRPARVPPGELGAGAAGWQLRFRTWRLLQVLFGDYGGGAVVGVRAPAGDPGPAPGSQSDAPIQGGAAEVPPAVARAIARMQAGDQQGAVAELQGALAADPANAVQYHQGLVQVLTSLGQRDRATQSVTWLEREYQQRPTAEAAEAYAVALAAIGDRRRALDVARAATERFPLHSPLWWVAGQGMYDTGDLTAAEQLLDQAVATADASRENDHWRASVRRDCARAACARDTCKAVHLLIAAMELDGDVDRCRLIVEGAAQAFAPDAVQRCLDGMKLSEQRSRLAQQLFSGLRAGSEDPDQRYDRRAVCEVLEHNLQRILERCRAHGAEPIVLSYPLVQPDLEAVHRKVAAENGRPHVPMLPRFQAALQQRSREELYVHDGHCSDDGYALMATALVDVVVQRLRR